MGNPHFDGLCLVFGLGNGKPSICLIKCLRKCFYSIVELSLELLHGIVL